MVKEEHVASRSGGGFGELFPSPAKGHQDNPGLSDEQGAEAQALVNADLG